MNTCQDILLCMYNLFYVTELLFSLFVALNSALRVYLGACKMAQWVEVLVTKAEELSSIPETHMVQGDSQLLPVFL